MILFVSRNEFGYLDDNIHGFYILNRNKFVTVPPKFRPPAKMLAPAFQRSLAYVRMPTRAFTPGSTPTASIALKAVLMICITRSTSHAYYNIGHVVRRVRLYPRHIRHYFCRQGVQILSLAALKKGHGRDRE